MPLYRIWKRRPGSLVCDKTEMTIEAEDAKWALFTLDRDIGVDLRWVIALPEGKVPPYNPKDEKND